jgi:6-phosphogluconolactonase
MSTTLRFVLSLTVCILMGASISSAASGPDTLVYIGTYTQPNKSQGIYLLHIDPATGALGEPQLAGKTISPSFLALHPNHKYLYAVNEVANFQGKKSGAVSAFSIDPGTGKLIFLNDQPSGGEGPCYVGVDHTGKVALVANYNSGSVASYPLDENGKLKEAATIEQHAGKGSDPQRQEGPHAHCFDVDPGNHFALANDLGLDKIFVYRLDTSSGKVTPNTPPTAALPAGSGPRHLTFSRDGRYIYCINEIASTVTVFQYDGGKGTLQMLETISTLPADFHGSNTTAEIIMHPSGKFLYGSNRGHDSIAIFRVDPTSGKLTAAGHESTRGKTPRGFNIDPSGQFLIAANQNTDNVVSFRIDQNSGMLKSTGSSVKVGSPVHVIFFASGQP